MYRGGEVVTRWAHNSENVGANPTSGICGDFMAKVQNIEALKAKIKKIADGYKDCSVTVGYTAAYALQVHENIEMKGKGLPRGGHLGRHNGIVYYDEETKGDTSGKGFYWDPQGKAQAKFLEAPARYLTPELGKIVATVGKRTKSLVKALIAAALRLGRESMTLVPVDTGNLKSSIGYRVNEGSRISIKS